MIGIRKQVHNQMRVLSARQNTRSRIADSPHGVAPNG